MLLNLTLELSLNPVNAGHCLCSFLARHPKDDIKYDDVVQWWLEWHYYTLGPDKIPVFGMWVLFHLYRTPDLAKHRLWTKKFFSRVKMAFSRDHSFLNLVMMSFNLVVLLHVIIGIIY